MRSGKYQQIPIFKDLDWGQKSQLGHPYQLHAHTHFWYSKCRGNGEINGCNSSISKSCEKQKENITAIRQAMSIVKSFYIDNFLLIW